MKLVVIESPLSPANGRTFEQNINYARLCCLDSIERRNEAPMASHLLYTQLLDDTNKEHRTLGISAGFAWGNKCDLVAVYTDFGISSGMALGVDTANSRGTAVEYRTLPADLMAMVETGPVKKTEGM
jgi:hypothetical protein